MGKQEHGSRFMTSPRGERWLLARLALLSLFCHIVTLSALLLLQEKSGTKSLPTVITVDLQTVLPSAGSMNGAAPKRAAPPPTPSRRPPTAPPRAAPPHPAAAEVPERAGPPLSPAADQPFSSALPSAGPAAPVIDGDGAGAPTPQPGVKGGIAGEGRDTSPVESAGPAVSGTGAGAARSADARRAYAEGVRMLIEKSREYPLMARKMRMQGVVLIRCRLTRAGTPVFTEVAAPSPYPLLDQAALRAVSCVKAFPPVPPEVEGEEIVLEIPLRFRLNPERVGNR